MALRFSWLKMEGHLLRVSTGDGFYTFIPQGHQGHFMWADCKEFFWVGEVLQLFEFWGRHWRAKGWFSI